MRHRNDIKDSTVLNLYLRKNLSMPAIANKFGVTQRTIWERLKRYGVTGATKDDFKNVPINELIEKHGPQRECAYCGSTFVPLQHNQLYCSRNCMRSVRQRQRNKRGVGTCPNCQQKFEKGHGGQRYCSKECYHAVRREGLSRKVDEVPVRLLRKFVPEVHLPRRRAVANVGHGA